MAGVAHAPDEACGSRDSGLGLPVFAPGSIHKKKRAALLLRLRLSPEHSEVVPMDSRERSLFPRRPRPRIVRRVHILELHRTLTEEDDRGLLRGIGEVIHVRRHLSKPTD